MTQFRRLAIALSLILAATAVLLLSDLSNRRSRKPEVQALIPIAMVQFSARETLEMTRAGAVAGLAERGWRAGEKLEFTRFNAENDLNVANAIAREVTAGRFQLILTASTPSLQTVANANRERQVPHIFATVTDPAAAGVGISPDSPLAHPAWLAGSGTFQPVAAIIRLAREINPGLRRLGTIWNPNEACAEACLLKARAICRELKIELVEVQVQSGVEVQEAARTLLSHDVDAIWIGGDNTVEAVVGSITVETRRRRIPVFTNNPDHIAVGALFTLGANYFEVGRAAGHLAAEFLAGAPLASMPIRDYAPELLSLNPPALQYAEAAWKFPPAILARADTIVVVPPGPAKPAR